MGTAASHRTHQVTATHTWGDYRDQHNNGEILTRRHEPVLTVSDRMSEARHEARLGFARSLPADLLLLLLLLLLRLC